MITLIHGDDLAASRNFYISERQKSKNPVIYEGNKVTLSELMQNLEGGSLFNDEKDIFIENFFTSKKTNSDFKKIIEYLESSKDSNIYFWENDILSKTDIGTFKNPTSKLFKIPQTLFVFLDNIRPSDYSTIKRFHELLNEMEAELVFYMLVRQFRLLLGVIENSSQNIDEVKRLAPWQTSKLKKQSLSFGIDKLKKSHQKLYEIDSSQKSGKLALTLPQAIDFFLLGL